MSAGQPSHFFLCLFRQLGILADFPPAGGSAVYR